jgi:hypothetical protein
MRANRVGVSLRHWAWGVAVLGVALLPFVELPRRGFVWPYLFATLVDLVVVPVLASLSISSLVADRACRWRLRRWLWHGVAAGYAAAGAYLVYLYR